MRVLMRGYRDHHVAYSLGAAYAQLGDSAAAIDGCEPLPIPGSRACRSSNAIRLLEPLRRRSDFAELLEHVRNRRELVLVAGRL